MADRKKTTKKKWWQWLLAYPTILTSAVGAVPQYTTWAKRTCSISRGTG